MKPPVAGALLVISVFAQSPAWAAGSPVSVPGLGVELSGLLYVPEGKGPFPAVVLMHGCSGLMDKSGRPNKSYVFWAEHFQKLGYTSLLLDSFTPRGVREICTQRSRAITPDKERSADAHAALAWLAKRDAVDAKRIHLLGWSNGAMTVLNAVRPDAAGRNEKLPSFRSAVAFYPGCAALKKNESYKPVTPLLIQAGAADDWTPAVPCEGLIDNAKKNGAVAEIDVYPDAHHGFDRIDVKVRVRPEVRNPHSPTGWGASVGTNELARQKAIKRATAFVQERNK